MDKKLIKALVDRADRAGFIGAAALIRKEARECAYFNNATEWPGLESQVGASRVGGWPDLPADVEWSDGFDSRGYRTGPMPLIAQINLSDLPPTSLKLPRKGYLWFFRKNANSVTGVQVIYRAGKPILTPRKRQTKGREGIALRFFQGLCLPLSGRAFRRKLEKFATDQSDWLKLDPFDSIQGSIGGECWAEEGMDFRRQIALEKLGRPDAVEADQWSHLQDKGQEFHQMGFGDGTYGDWLERHRGRLEWISKNEKKIAAEAARWLCLASFHGNWKAGFDIGDAMAMDIFIRDSDLAARNFGNLVVECPMLL